MNEYNENKEINEEIISMQDLPEQINSQPRESKEEERQEEQKEKKGNTLVKILILIILILLLTHACGAYYYQKEINAIKKNCEASCNSRCKTPDDQDKDVKDPDIDNDQDKDNDQDQDNDKDNDKDQDQDKDNDKDKDQDSDKDPDEDTRKPEIDNRVWQVKFANPTIGEGSVEKGSISLSNNTSLNFYSELAMPGDYFTFTVDVYNYGDVAAKLGESPRKSSLTDSQKRYLLYDVRYADGTEIKANDTLEVGETKKIVFRIEFMREITAEDLPQQEETINFAYELTYVEK